MNNFGIVQETIIVNWYEVLTPDEEMSITIVKARLQIGLNKALVDKILLMSNHITVGLSDNGRYLFLKPSSEGHHVKRRITKANKLAGTAIYIVKDLREKFIELDVLGRYPVVYDAGNGVFIADLTKLA